MLWETSRDSQLWQRSVPESARSMTDFKRQNASGAVQIRRTDRYGMPKNTLVHSEMWCIGSHDDKALSHYGVTGMHWGEITKEYVPKGYYKQRTMTAAQYRKRRKIKKTVSPQYESAKAAGRRVGDAFFAENRQRYIEKKRQEYEAAHPKEKGPDLVDKATQKAFDHFSLGAYSQLASKFIKDTAQNEAIKYLKSKSGKIIKVGGKYAGNIGKVVSKPVSLAGKGIIAGGHGLEKLVKTGIKKTPKGLVKATKLLGKAGKSTLKGLHKTSKWYRGHRAEIRQSLLAGRSFVRRIANTGHRISRFTGSSIQSGGRLVQSGAKSLLNILKKTKRG